MTFCLPKGGRGPESKERISDIFGFETEVVHFCFVNVQNSSHLGQISLFF